MEKRRAEQYRSRAIACAADLCVERLDVLEDFERSLERLPVILRGRLHLCSDHV